MQIQNNKSPYLNLDNNYFFNLIKKNKQIRESCDNCEERFNQHIHSFDFKKEQENKINGLIQEIESITNKIVTSNGVNHSFFLNLHYDIIPCNFCDTPENVLSFTGNFQISSKNEITQFNMKTHFFEFTITKYRVVSNNIEIYDLSNFNNIRFDNKNIIFDLPTTYYEKNKQLRLFIYGLNNEKEIWIECVVDENKVALSTPELL